MLKLHTEGEANQVNYKYKKNLRRTKKKGNETIKYIRIRDIKILLEQEHDSYQPLRVGSFWRSNYIEYERKGVYHQKNTLRKLKPYLMNMIICSQKPVTYKAQLTRAINFISSKDVD